LVAGAAAAHVDGIQGPPHNITDNKIELIMTRFLQGYCNIGPLRPIKLKYTDIHCAIIP
jgi:hypothetical protein